MGPADYISPDDRYGELVKNVINPPPDQTAQAQAGAQPPPTASPAPGPRPAAAALTQTPAPGPSPVPAVKPPTPTPTSVTPSGAGPTAVGAPPKTWADYVRSANDKSMQSMDQAQSAAAALQNQPSATSLNATLEQRRQSFAAPIPYRNQTTGKVLTSATDPVTGEQINPEKLYKPGIGTRIVRGIDAVRRGGAMGAFDPKDVGGTAYGDPNANYRAAEAARQAVAGQISQEEQRNIANEKADSERLGKIGTDLRAVATGYQDVAKTSTAQQTAEQKADYNQQVEDTKKQLADIRQQLADQGGKPKTYEQAVLASNDPDLTPAERQQYAASARQIAATEVKKFQYANQAIGDADPRRQPIIDDATSKIEKLNTFEWDADANNGAGGFYDPSTPTKIYSPSEFTAMKNEIATKIDKDLTAKKMRPLGVRFNVKDTTPGAPSAPPPAPAATPAQTAPRSAAEVQKGQTYNGYKYLGGDKTQKASWQKVGK